MSVAKATSASLCAPGADCPEGEDEAARGLRQELQALAAQRDQLARRAHHSRKASLELRGQAARRASRREPSS